MKRGILHEEENCGEDSQGGRHSINKTDKTTKKPSFNPDPFTVVEIKGTQAMLDTWKETEKEFQQYPGGQK